MSPRLPIIALLATSVLFAFATTARPDGEPAEYARAGAYLRFGPAIGFERSKLLADLNARISAQVEVDPLLGASLGLGWRLHPRLAVEGAFDWMRGRIDFTLPDRSPVPGTLDIGTWTTWRLSADVKGYVATGIVQPYAAVGLGVMRQTRQVTEPAFAARSGTETGFAPRFGGGLDVHLMRHVALNVDAGYLLGTGDLDGADSTSLRVGVVGRY